MRKNVCAAHSVRVRHAVCGCGAQCAGAAHVCGAQCAGAAHVCGAQCAGVAHVCGCAAKCVGAAHSVRVRRFGEYLTSH